MTLVSQRCHIAFFGCVNSGKSSLINAISNQDVSVVSKMSGTTTDPVKKTMEILPLGPVVLFDTAGIDDTSELGKLRVDKTYKVLNKADIAILVADASLGLKDYDKNLIKKFKEKNIPYLIVYNKSDLKNDIKINSDIEIKVSAKEKTNINDLKEKIAKFALLNKKEEKFIICDKLNKNDIVVLSIPIDESAPKGRLILPQQNTLRELLDFNCIAVCTQPEELKSVIDNLNKKPKLVITDSQAFGYVKNIVDNDIMLTSFSILFARYKGMLDILTKGAKKIDELKTGDKILISEGCTHHRQCNDIGTVKFPKWLKEYTNKDFQFEFSSGEGFSDDLEKFSLIIHCGACMLNENEMHSRIQKAVSNNIPIVNYGIAIAYMNGILKRALEIFPETLKILKGE